MDLLSSAIIDYKIGMPSTILRDVSSSDLEHLHEWYNSNEAMGKFDEPSFPQFERVLKKFNDGGYKTTWIVEADGQPVGFANFAVHPWDDWIAVIGIIIAKPDFRGKGIGTVAHRLLVENIFSNFSEIQKIEALTDVENLAEARALQKSGFAQEGTLKRKNRLRGQFKDMSIYGLLRP